MLVSTISGIQPVELQGSILRFFHDHVRLEGDGEGAGFAKLGFQDFSPLFDEDEIGGGFFGEAHGYCGGFFQKGKVGLEGTALLFEVGKFGLEESFASFAIGGMGHGLCSCGRSRQRYLACGETFGALIVGVNVVFYCKPDQDFVDDAGVGLLVEAVVFELDV